MTCINQLLYDALLRKADLYPNNQKQQARYVETAARKIAKVDRNLFDMGHIECSHILKSCCGIKLQRFIKDFMEDYVHMSSTPITQYDKVKEGIQTFCEENSILYKETLLTDYKEYVEKLPTGFFGTTKEYKERDSIPYAVYMTPEEEGYHWAKWYSHTIKSLKK